MRRPLFSLLLALVSFMPVALMADELTVFAAASLSDALRETQPSFERETGHTLRFNFGASGTLARQIREGAPADVFLSADEARVDQLEKSGLTLADTRRILLANTLVVVVPDGGPLAVSSLADLKTASFRRIAIGDPATVPAGTYAREYLQKVGLWEALSPRLIPVDSVRAALAAVETGNADAAFIYRTDALVSKRCHIVAEIPRQEGPRIVYPAVVMKDAKAAAAAQQYLAWLAKPAARDVFARYGFLEPAP